MSFSAPPHPASRPTAPAPDTLALARVARGDIDGLGEVYDRHAAALSRFAARIAGTHEAEDLVHATFLKVIKVAGAYDGRASTARSWLFGVMARLVQERRRAVLRFARAVLRMRDAPSSGDAPQTAHRSDLERGLGKMSDAKRVVLILAEVEGYTCEEIAEMLKVPIGTVWTRLHHARNDLRAFYRADSP